MFYILSILGFIGIFLTAVSVPMLIKITKVSFSYFVLFFWAGVLTVGITLIKVAL